MTRSDPSTIFARICASVTASTGGVSKIIRSYDFFASSIRFCIFFDANNSDGFGGIGPQEITSRLSTSLATAVSCNVFSPTRILLNPDRKSTRLNSQSRGHLVCRLLLEKKKTEPTSSQLR